MKMTWEDYLAAIQSLESKKPENESRSSIGEIRARYDQLVKKHDQQLKHHGSGLKNAMIYPKTIVPRAEDGNVIEPEPGAENEDAADRRKLGKPHLYTYRHDYERAYITNLVEPQGVSAADIDAAKISAQTIINSESLMKGDMINEGHEQTAFDAAIQSKQFLNDRPRHETYATELTRIRKESGRGVKIIEGRVNKYYGPGQLKLYEKTAVLSLSRNLKVAYDIKDLKGQMPETQEKAIPVCGIKLLIDENGDRKTHIIPAKEKAAERER